MPAYMAFVCIILPIITGVSLFLINFNSRRARLIYIMIMLIISSAFTITFLVLANGETFYLWYIMDDIYISFKVDGLGSVFAGLVSVLWPPATLYAFEYMKKEERQISFFAFYCITYGVTLGICFASDVITMYVFYEFLTLVTIPLVFHYQTVESRRAVRKYMYYSIAGAALGFMTIAFVIVFSQNLDFVYGGILNERYVSFNYEIMRLVYVLAFLGFGVKAAVFPLHGWLPTASVAPTPVTALLHAVAVVKSGAFVIMRMTYYVFGADFLEGTNAQIAVMMIACVTIIYGSVKAVKERHIKRRLAYSTISNLSYILLGVSFMTPWGLFAALLHMIFHAIIKISLFFCAGSIMHYAHKTQVDDLEGLGKKMPFIFTCFSICSLALMGVPPLAGFFSKFQLAYAAIDAKQWYSYIGATVLFVSAGLMVIYLLFIAVKAFFPKEGHVITGEIKNPGMLMKLPIAFFTVLSILVAFFMSPLINYLINISFGLI